MPQRRLLSLSAELNKRLRPDLRGGALLQGSGVSRHQAVRGDPLKDPAAPLCMVSSCVNLAPHFFLPVSPPGRSNEQELRFLGRKWAASWWP